MHVTPATQSLRDVKGPEGEGYTGTQQKKRQRLYRNATKEERNQNVERSERRRLYKNATKMCEGYTGLYKNATKKCEGYTGYCEAMSVIKLVDASPLVFPHRSRHMNSSR